MFDLLYTHKFQVYNSGSIPNWIKASFKANNIIKPIQYNEGCLYFDFSSDTDSTSKLEIDVPNGLAYGECSQPITCDTNLNCSNTAFSSSYNLKGFNLQAPSNTVKFKYAFFNEDTIKPYPLTINSKTYNNVSLNYPNQELTRSVKIYAVPYGTQHIKRYQQNSLASYAINTPINVPVLPNAFLNNQLTTIDRPNSCSLEEWALGLLNLIELKEEILVYKSLLFISQYIQQTGAAGLPSVLISDLSNIQDKERSVYYNSLAGYAILQAVAYLCNRPQSQIITIPANLPTVLDSINLLINNLSNLSTGEVLSGYDAYGGFITSNYNTVTSYAVSIYLNQYLNYFFNLPTLLLCERVQLYCINKVTLDFESLDLDIEIKLQIAVSKLHWVLYYQRNLDLIPNLVNFITTNVIKLKTLGKYAVYLTVYLLQRIKTFVAITIPFDLRYSSVFVDYLDLVIARNNTTDKFINLIDCSWGNLIKQDSNLFTPLIFKLNTDSINLDVEDLHQSAVNAWPDGDRWGSYNAVYNKQSVIGSLFSGTAFVAQDWVIFYNFLLKATACSTSNGAALDAWGKFIKYSRPFGQGDYYYKETLLILLNKQKPTLNNLKTFIFNLLNERVTSLQYNTFPLVYTRDHATNVWSSRAWVGNKADVDLIKSQLNPQGQPCFYLPNRYNPAIFELVPVYKFTSTINLNLQLVDSISAAFIKDFLAAGVSINLNKTHTFLVESAPTNIIKHILS